MAGEGSPRDTAETPSSCPVDHKTRSIWLEQARQTSPSNQTEKQTQVQHHRPRSAAEQQQDSPSTLTSSKWGWSSLFSLWQTTGPSTSDTETPPTSSSRRTRPLSHDREVSSIPRAYPSASPAQASNSPNASSSPSSPSSLPLSPSNQIPSWSHAIPANSEIETGSSPAYASVSSSPSPSSHTSFSINSTATTATAHDSTADNKEQPASSSLLSSSPQVQQQQQRWVYPSERMFFEALRRKEHDPRAQDMATVVPIHNAVNERAWALVLEWERRFAWTRAASVSCGGPRLRSFSGRGIERLSPRARFNALLGYQAPFDRHDWLVERCSGEADSVEYVIDFYAGRPGGTAPGKDQNNKGEIGSSPANPPPLNFYLDVRPKLNSWEGCKMRLAGFFGLG